MLHTVEVRHQLEVLNGARCSGWDVERKPGVNLRGMIAQFLQGKAQNSGGQKRVGRAINRNYLVPGGIVSTQVVDEAIVSLRPRYAHRVKAGLYRSDLPDEGGHVGLQW